MSVHSLSRGRDDLPADSTVREYLRPYERFLYGPGVTEVCVNRPGELWTLADGEWENYDVPELDFDHSIALARAVATYSAQYVGEATPLLSATLPMGQRIQFCLPSATLAGIAGICIRIPSTRVLTLEELKRNRFFSRVGTSKLHLRPWEEDLLALKDTGNLDEFFRQAMRRELTMIVAGKTGSGKTTFMKSLAEEIPRTRRIVTIEDAQEMTLPSHANKLNLLFSKGGQGASDVSPKKLLEACNRLRPDWVLLAEIRGEEGYSFLRLAASGHPGLTSLHAGSCDQTFDQIALMVRESPAGAGMAIEDIKHMARENVDVVVHVDDDDGKHITEVYYDPSRRLRRGAK